MSGIGLAFDSGIWEALLALACAGAFAALWPVLRGLPRTLLALRFGAVALLIVLISKPVLHRTEARSARPRLAVLLDRGPSMRAEDGEGSSRLARAARWLLENRRALCERADITLLGASGGARRLSWEELSDLKPESAALEPASVFADVLEAGAPPARVWLLSDGAFDPGEALGSALARLRSPVDALGVGPRETRKAASVTGVESPDFVFLHSRFPLSIAVEAEGLDGETVTVGLKRGSESLGEVRHPVRLPYEVFQDTFTVEATALGRQSYRVELRRFGQRTVSRDFGVEVIRQKYRIMYLAGRPSFEYTHLRAQLKGDPNHEMVSFVILRNPENVAPVPDNELSLIPFPATEIFVQNLFQFDLFILENFAYWRFHLPTSYLENLKRFVAQGGALLVIGGSNAFTQGGYQGTPLEETLPVKLWTGSEDFVPGLFSPTVAAPTHPMLHLGDTPEASAELWKSLPALDGYSRFAAVRPGSSVLLAHPSEKTGSGEPLPVVAVREFGRGKVMLVGTESTWRWKLGGGRDWRIASFYGRFWGRAVEYLTGNLDLKKVKFSPLPDRMPAREPAVLTLHVFDDHFRPVPGSDLVLRLDWKAPGGKGRKAPFFEREPGVFQIELNDLEEGRHAVRALARYRGQLWGEDSAEFRWEPAAGRAAIDRKNLSALAGRTGGSYQDLHRADLKGLLAALPPVRTERFVASRLALWTHGAWLWAVCGALLVEWLLRRRRGLL